MEFRVLGPPEVYSDDTRVHVGGVKQRSILALLIANRGGVVSTDRIVDEVYGDDAAVGVRRSVQTIVSTLRRSLGDVIVGSGDGYRFDASRSTVDAGRFEDQVAEGLALVRSDPRQAAHEAPSLPGQAARRFQDERKVLRIETVDEAMEFIGRR